MAKEKYDVIIIGAGAAGLFCAIEAAKRGQKVLLLDHANKVGKKILMSGGGRCNFTNLHITPENYLSQNPHFCKSALSQYTQWDFIALVDKYNIPYHEKKWAIPSSNGEVEEVGQGQLFCDNSSKDIVNMLLTECQQYSVAIKTECAVNTIEKTAQGFSLTTSLGHYQSEKLVIATGGLSIPKMGATGFAYKVAEQFGLDVLPTRAGLVPFVLTDHTKIMAEKLSGLAHYVELSNTERNFIGPLLFTHRGISGPSVLQLSSYWQAGQVVAIDLLTTMSQGFLLDEKRQNSKVLLRTVFNKIISKQLVQELEAQFWLDYKDIPLQEISNNVLHELEQALRNWKIKPSTTEGYRTAEVTLGGINTGELSSKTMQSKKVQGLYFIGEAIDVTGHLGGYNFQWAWSSAFAAANSFQEY